MAEFPRVRLEEVLLPRRDRPDIAKIESGEIQVVSKISFADGRIELRSSAQTKTGMILVHPGDLVISGINATKGAVAIFNPHASSLVAATIHYSSYAPRRDKIDIRFLWWLLRSEIFRESLLVQLPGGIKSELKPDRFLQVVIPLPPLDEQRRIVARIEALARRVEEARGLRREAVEEVDAFVKRTTDLAFTTATSKREPLRTLLAEPLINGLSVPSAKLGTGITFAKVGIVNSGRFDPKQTKLVDVDLPQSSPYWLRDNDVLVSRGNTLGLVGRAAVYEGDPPNCAMTDLLIRIRVDPTKSDPHFVSRFFRSSEAREYIESRVSGTSPTMKKISQPKLEAMPIPTLPLPEQRRIVAYLDGLQAKVDALRHLQAETQRELDALMPAVLARAFAGEL
jgi:type I restriction enzyme S subunit